MNSLAQKFLVLSQREQIAVISCSVFLTCALLWVILISPAYAYYSQASLRVKDNTELVSWIEQNRSRFESISQSSSSNDNNEDINLLQVVSQTAEQQSIQINRIEPTFDGLVRSTYTGVSFPAFLSLVQQLESSNVVIESVNIDSTTAPGFVNASLVVSAP